MVVRTLCTGGTDIARMSVSESDKQKFIDGTFYRRMVYRTFCVFRYFETNGKLDENKQNLSCFPILLIFKTIGRFRNLRNYSQRRKMGKMYIFWELKNGFLHCRKPLTGA